MNDKIEHTILFVDDEESILKSLNRLFRRQGHTVLTAGSGEEGLAVLEREGNKVSLIVSDQRMPNMNGAAFLEKAKQICPDAIRFLLTGYSEMDAIVAAVNKGEIHKYITKPWNDDELVIQVNSALSHYDLVAENKRLTALTQKQNRQLFDIAKNMEKKIQERTLEITENNKRLEFLNKELEFGLMNTVRAFAALADTHTPYMKGHGKRVSSLSVEVARKFNLKEGDVTDIEIAAVLHDIGTIGFSNDLIEKHKDNRCSKEEEDIYRTHPVEGQNILAFINRLDEVGTIIRHHHERYDGTGYPDRLYEREIPLGSRIIAVADIYDRICMRSFKKNDPYIEKYVRGCHVVTEHMDDKELTRQAAIYHIKQSIFQEFDPDVVKFFFEVLAEKGISQAKERPLTLGELETGMVLTRPVYSNKGRFLLPEKTVLNQSVLDNLKTKFEPRDLPEYYFISHK